MAIFLMVSGKQLCRVFPRQKGAIFGSCQDLRQFASIGLCNRTESDMDQEDAQEQLEDHFANEYDAYVNSWPDEAYVKHPRSLIPKTNGPPLHKSINLLTSQMNHKFYIDTATVVKNSSSKHDWSHEIHNGNVVYLSYIGKDGERQKGRLLVLVVSRSKNHGRPCS